MKEVLGINTLPRVLQACTFLGTGGGDLPLLRLALFKKDKSTKFFDKRVHFIIYDRVYVFFSIFNDKSVGILSLSSLDLFASNGNANYYREKKIFLQDKVHVFVKNVAMRCSQL